MQSYHYYFFLLLLLLYMYINVHIEIWVNDKNSPCIVGLPTSVGLDRMNGLLEGELEVESMDFFGIFKSGIPHVQRNLWTDQLYDLYVFFWLGFCLLPCLPWFSSIQTYPKSFLKWWEIAFRWACFDSLPRCWATRIVHPSEEKW